MDSFKNRMWMIPFKNFSRLKVNRKITGNHPPAIFGTVPLSLFKGCQDENLKKLGIEAGQYAWMCRLAWLCTGGNG